MSSTQGFDHTSRALYKFYMSLGVPTMCPPATAEAKLCIRSPHPHSAEPCGDLPSSQQPEAFYPSLKGGQVSTLFQGLLHACKKK